MRPRPIHALEAPLPSWERGGGEGAHATDPSPQPSPARAEGAHLRSLVPARTAPPPAPAWQRWRRALWGSPWQAAATLLLGALLLWGGAAALRWGVVNAVWAPDVTQCQAVRGQGACWGVVAEKHRVLLFGRYPHAEQWRALLASAVLVAMLAASGWRRCWRPALGVAWGLATALVLVLMGGGVAGLAPVPTELWGGLPLTLLLSVLGIVFAFPLAIGVALGRRSRLPALRSLCVAYVELVRGVPLISVLFMASFMFPLLLPPGRSPDVLLRVLAGIVLFAAAYMAETVRGGLQSVPRGQTEAARALGLTRWQVQRHVVLPQALAAVVPGLLNSFISIFKDTSLVTIVSLYELTGALSLALNADADWRPFKLEAYLFIAAIYFAGCHAMSRYSLWIEAHLAQGRAR